MVIAVPIVRVVQASIHQIVGVIAMRNHLGFVRAVPALARNGLAAVGIGVGYFNHMLVVVPLMLAVQMPVVQSSFMVIVLNNGVAASGPVNVFMIFMHMVSHYKKTSRSASVSRLSFR